MSALIYRDSLLVLNRRKSTVALKWNIFRVAFWSWSMTEVQYEVQMES